MNTGELIAVRLTDHEVRQLGRFRDREHVEDALAGWADHCGPAGLRWVEQQARVAAL